MRFSEVLDSLQDVHPIRIYLAFSNAPHFTQLHECLWQSAADTSQRLVMENQEGRKIQAFSPFPPHFAQRRKQLRVERTE
ncbi:MAG TPA: hypothetical protein VHP35_08530, partial [Terriglobia bacterium]|nr:hypothetical protein [Terriglobia bacterium]